MLTIVAKSPNLTISYISSCVYLNQFVSTTKLLSLLFKYSVIFNNKKLKEVAPDFKCNISIKEGILKYLDYMENNPNLQKEEPDFDEWCEKIIEKYNEFKNSIAEII